MHRLPLLAVCATASCSWFSADAPRGTPPEDLQCQVRKSSACFEFIPGGTFLRGAQSTDPDAPGYHPDARPDEGPVREVTVPGFWIQREETPYSKWVNCPDDQCPKTPDGPRRGIGDLSQIATALTYPEAEALCASMGARVPSETEWSFAARGPEARTYPWGDNPPCGFGSPHDRTQMVPPSQWGQIPGCEGLDDPRSARERTPTFLKDMAWGVYEWTSDAYSPSGHDGARDPSLQVTKGGSFASTEPSELRSSARAPLPPQTRLPDVGVRCAF